MKMVVDRVRDGKSVWSRNLRIEPLRPVRDLGAHLSSRFVESLGRQHLRWNMMAFALFLNELGIVFFFTASIVLKGCLAAR